MKISRKRVAEWGEAGNDEKPEAARGIGEPMSSVSNPDPLREKDLEKNWICLRTIQRKIEEILAIREVNVQIKNA
jgi:hypothetical protein